MEIRLARADELAAVGRLTGEVYVGEGYITTGDDYVHDLADAARRAAEAELWVATDDEPSPESIPGPILGPILGPVLGTVTFCPEGSTYREIGRAGEGEFRMLAVSPEARGRGVGRALVQHCLDRSRELGYAGVRMSTMDTMTSAHRIYQRLGFTRAVEDDWSPAPGVSLLAYARPL